MSRARRLPRRRAVPWLLPVVASVVALAVVVLAVVGLPGGGAGPSGSHPDVRMVEPAGGPSDDGSRHAVAVRR